MRIEGGSGETGMDRIRSRGGLKEKGGKMKTGKGLTTRGILTRGRDVATGLRTGGGRTGSDQKRTENDAGRGLMSR